MLLEPHDLHSIQNVSPVIPLTPFSFDFKESIYWMTQQGANATAAPAATPVTASTYGAQSVPSAHSNRFDQVKVSVLLFHLSNDLNIFLSTPMTCQSEGMDVPKVMPKWN